MGLPGLLPSLLLDLILLILLRKVDDDFIEGSDLSGCRLGACAVPRETEQPN